MGIFVFEAKKMPFEELSEDYAAPALALLREMLGDGHHSHLTNIAERKKEEKTVVAVPPAQDLPPPPSITTITTTTTSSSSVSSKNNTTTTTYKNNNKDDDAFIKEQFSLWERAMLVAVWQVMAPYRQQQQQQQQQREGIKKKNQNPEEVGVEEKEENRAHLLTQQQVELAMKIVRGLDELESVYEGAKNTYYDEDAEGYLAPPPPPTTAQQEEEEMRCAGSKAHLEEEEAIMNAIFQERFGIPYPPAAAPPTANTTRTQEENATAQRNAVEVDVAICFNERGDTVGVGSAAVFGGQGYHP